MYHDHDFHPEPPAHTHEPGQTPQSYPLNPNHNHPGYAPPPPMPECSPVPPPIPPVRYVPGMNVQEQLGNMAERVNIAIGRWNEIQRNCYAALDQVVGAAVNNDVYYSPDEVRVSTGYSDDMSCSYVIVEAKACDRSGRPIFCHLRPAYNSETNSGATENIQDVSFVTSAQMVMTAFQAGEPRWKGTSIFNGNPGNSAPDDTVWVAGWNRNGTLRFFPGDASLDVMRQNRMVNCIGPVFPILSDGKPFTEVLESMGSNPGAIQAMGWKSYNGNKVFFSCSMYDNPGMSPESVAKILQHMGVTNAVITSYQTAPVNDGGTMAIEEAPVNAATGGLTFLGQLMTAPENWEIPSNPAMWVISKRPPKGWRNSFTTEVADIVQKLGSTNNTLNSITGQMDILKEALQNVENDTAQNAADIAEAKADIENLQTNVQGIEERLSTAEDTVAKNTADIAELTSKLNGEISTREQQYQELKQANENEKNEREAADRVLDSKIRAEKSARESADTILQNNISEEANIRASEDDKLRAEIDSEAKTRAEADRNLQSAIEAEQSARSTKDSEHDARMDAIAAKESKDVAELDQKIADAKDDLENQINDITSGNALPVASKEQKGIMQVGDGLKVEDGVVSVIGGGTGGVDIQQGDGILITTPSEGVREIAIDTDVVATKSELDALEENVSNLGTKVSEIDETVSGMEERVGNLETEQTSTDSRLESLEDDSANKGRQIQEIQSDISGLKDGSELPIATTEKLGVIKVGANLSISPDGTLSASAGEGGGGNTIAQGEGIKVDFSAETNVATVSLSDDTITKLTEIDNKANNSELEQLKNELNEKASTETVNKLQDELNNKANQSTVEELSNKVDEKASQTDLDELKDEVEKKADTSALDELKEEMEKKADSSSVSDLNSKLDDLEKEVQNLPTAEEVDKELDKKANADEVQQQEEKLAQLETGLDEKVAKSGDTMTGALQLNSGLVLATADGTVVGNVGVTQDGVMTINGVSLADIIVRGVKNPEVANDAANKQYVDTQIGEVSETANNANVAAAEAASAAAEAKTAADEAKQASEGGPFLPLSGGNMDGPIRLNTPNYESGLLGAYGDLGINIMSEAMAGGSNPGTSAQLNLMFKGTSEHPQFPSAISLESASSYVGLHPIRPEEYPDPNSVTGALRIFGVADPRYPSEAANKRYVDEHSGGGGGEFKLKYLKSYSLKTNGFTVITNSLPTPYKQIYFASVKVYGTFFNTNCTGEGSGVLVNIHEAAIPGVQVPQGLSMPMRPNGSNDVTIKGTAFCNITNSDTIRVSCEAGNQTGNIGDVTFSIDLYTIE